MTDPGKRRRGPRRASHGNATTRAKSMSTMSARHRNRDGRKPIALIDTELRELEQHVRSPRPHSKEPHRQAPASSITSPLPLQMLEGHREPTALPATSRADGLGLAAAAFALLAFRRDSGGRPRPHRIATVGHVRERSRPRLARVSRRARESSSARAPAPVAPTPAPRHAHTAGAAGAHRGSGAGGGLECPSRPGRDPRGHHSERRPSPARAPAECVVIRCRIRASC